jgi:hypothetical protein
MLRIKYTGRLRGGEGIGQIGGKNVYCIKRKKMDHLSTTRSLCT